MRPAMTDAQRKHRTATSRAMKAHAEARRCPDCDRKSALQMVPLTERHVMFVCRWCKREFEPGPGP